GEHLEEPRALRALVGREAGRAAALTYDEAVARRGADRGDLRVGEGDRRDGAVVGAGRPTGRVGRGHARLVLAGVREHGNAGHVARGPHAVACAHALVDLDAAHRDLEAERLEAEPLDRGPPAGGDDQALAREGRAAFQTHVDPGLDALDL